MEDMAPINQRRWPRRVSDLPAAANPSAAHLVGVHGLFVNGVRLFDCKDYAKLDKGPGQVLDRFLPARASTLASAAQ
jgi:hypothetical protein